MDARLTEMRCIAVRKSARFTKYISQSSQLAVAAARQCPRLH